MKKISVLLADDDKLIRQMVRAGLGDEFTFLEAGSVSEVRAVLVASSVDAVMLDLSMPDSSAMDTMRLLPEFAAKTAVIVWTGWVTTSRERIEPIDPLVERAMRLGAQDFIAKGDDHDFREMARIIRHSVARQRASHRCEAIRTGIDKAIELIDSAPVPEDMMKQAREMAELRATPKPMARR